MQALDRFTARLHANNFRPDGRDPLQSRQPTVRYLPLNGQLVFSQGNTSVVVKVRAEITSPKPQRPAEGFIHFRIDCQNCQGNTEQNRKLSIEACKLLETVVVGSKALDPQSLCILYGRYAWRIAVQGTVIADDGNVIDCLLNGVLLALIDTRKPLVKLDQSEMEVENSTKQPLSLAHIPVSLSFALVEGNIFADPNAAEQRVTSSRITITMNVYKELCSIHKPGGLGISEATLSGCVKIMEQKVAQKTAWMRTIAKERHNFIDTV